MSNSISFWGAARTVTGSKYLLKVNGKQILIDCGLFQGGRELRDRNWEPFGFDPNQLDAVIVTHAHIDHIGLLPKLVKEGYQGPIYATPGTIGIARISLPDSARLQEEEARTRNKHNQTRHSPALPLYTEEDAKEVLKRLKPVRYDQEFDLPGGASFTFHPAGHILGSARIDIKLPDGETLVMGGDLGRFNTPIITDPAKIHQADYLVIESTYGDRIHSDEDAKAKLETILNDAYKNGKCVIVPSFAIGRTQELLYYITLLQQESKIPRIPIYIDSPMATSATVIYDATIEDHDVDMKLLRGEGIDPLHPENVSFVRDRNQSKAINSQSGPMMIISGSGMANGGRVIHHLLHRLSDPNTVVLFTGYQGIGTLGRRLFDGEPTVRILGHEIEPKAQIEKLNSLSAHADYTEILHWLKDIKVEPKQTFIVHGEPEAQAALVEHIKETLGWKNITIPEQGDEFMLKF